MEREAFFFPQLTREPTIGISQCGEWRGTVDPYRLCGNCLYTLLSRHCISTRSMCSNCGDRKSVV